MNNPEAIEVLEKVKLYYAQNVIQKSETGRSRLEAVQAGIDALKAVENPKDNLMDK